MHQLTGVYETGRPDGPVVLLLHSSLSSARQWQTLTEQLASDWRVINLDLLGYGQAPRADTSVPFALEQEVQRIEHILSHYKVDSFTLVGHSYGGAVALKLAYEMPQRVRGLALFEPVAFHLLDEKSAALQEVLGISRSMMSEDDVRAARQFVDYWNGDGYFDRLPGRVQSAMTSQVSKVRLDFQGLIGEGYTLADYASLTMPCLLMSGQDSRLSSRAIAKALQETLPDCQGLTTAGGHMAPISHADAVNPRILDFLYGVQPLSESTSAGP